MQGTSDEDNNMEVLMGVTPITPPLADSIAGGEAYLFTHQRRRHHFQGF
jgi:hypothetical protein